LHGLEDLFSSPGSVPAGCHPTGRSRLTAGEVGLAGFARRADRRRSRSDHCSSFVRIRPFSRVRVEPSALQVPRPLMIAISSLKRAFFMVSVYTFCWELCTGLGNFLSPAQNGLAQVSYWRSVICRSLHNISVKSFQASRLSLSVHEPGCPVQNSRNISRTCFLVSFMVLVYPFCWELCTAGRTFLSRPWPTGRWGRR